MAHWAQIDNDNKVIQVLVTNNDDPAGDEGLSWLQNTLGGTWIQTSYNSKIRGKFAGIGDTYDHDLDLFVAPDPIIIEVTDEAETI